MEKIKLGSWTSQAKIVGTIVSIAGAFVVVLYNGPALISNKAHYQKPNPLSNILLHQVSVQSSWILGGVCLATEYILVALWYIYQAKVMKEYPAEMVLVFSYNLSCSLLSLVDCLINERNFNAWKVSPDVQLMSILYAAILGKGFSVAVHTWGLHVKGPVYVALFCPLSIAIAAIMSVILLGDNLYLGSVIGSIIITVGFYTVIWGKASEEDGTDDSDGVDIETSYDPNVPLLDYFALVDEAQIFLIPPLI